MTRLNIPLFVALAASILSAVPANARDTLPHQRMIRKRGPSIDGPGPVGAAAVIGLHVRQVAVDPTGSASRSSSAAASPSASASSAPSSAAPSTSSTPTSSAPGSTSTSSSSSAAASTSSGGLLDSISAILGSTSSTSSTAPTSSSVPSTSSTPTPTSTSTSAAQAPQTTPKPAEETPSLNIATSAPAATSRSQSVSVNIIYSTQAAAEASASAEAQKKKTEKITKNTIISLVVIASCIGGAIAIWTVIRKWKLSPSEKFDDRMQPIDWAPPPANGTPEDAIEEKTKHRRAGSGASHGSFTSGGVGQSEQGHGAKGGMYADSQYSHGYGTQPQDFPPPHDFTAGAAQPGYGQYYGGQQYAGGHGYADLQRGPSMSESTYSQGANVSRGLSYSRGHGAYDSQSGAVPPMPNPYGGEYGYDDYNHPPAGQQPQAQGQAPYRAF